MLKKISAVLILFLAVSGCSKTAQNEDSQKLKVYTSFYAMYDLAKEVGGDRAEVINMVSPGAEAHDYEPSAKEIALLGEADLFVYSGNGMEPWVDSVAKSVENKVTVVNTGADIETDSGKDPHTWLSPMLALKQAQSICDAMIQCDPENESVYRENIKKFEEKANRLEERRTQIVSKANKAIVVSHKAYAYLGVEQIGIENEHGTGDPSPAQLAQAIDYIKENDVKYIFTSDTEPSKAAETAARETGAELLTLSTMEGDAQNRDYAAIMEENLDRIEEAVK